MEKEKWKPDAKEQAKYNQLKEKDVTAARTYLSMLPGADAEAYYQRMVKELHLDRNLSLEHSKRRKDRETIEIEEKKKDDEYSL